MHLNWVVSYILFVRLPCIDYLPVPLLKPTLILSTRNLKGTGNFFVTRCLIEVEVSKNPGKAGSINPMLINCRGRNKHCSRSGAYASIVWYFMQWLHWFCSLVIGLSNLWLTGTLNSIQEEGFSNSYVIHFVLWSILHCPVPQQRGLQQLNAANILDHHALPGVASPNQMFAGR